MPSSRTSAKRGVNVTKALVKVGRVGVSLMDVKGLDL